MKREASKRVLCILSICWLLGCAQREHWQFVESDGTLYRGSSQDSWITVVGTNMTGTLTTFSSSGSPYRQSYFVNGSLHGTDKVWYENGQLKSECKYENGELNGPSYRWYVDGQKWQAETYLDGKEHGKSQLWYQNGQIKQIAHCVRGAFHGRRQVWDRKGRIVEDAVYTNGAPWSGQIIVEWIEGQPPLVGIVQDGDIVSDRVLVSDR